MPTPRRLRTVKALGLLALLITLITLYITSSARQTRSSEFYTKTSAALAAKKAAADRAAAAAISDQDVGKRLKEAEHKAKKAAEAKGKAFHEAVGGSGAASGGKGADGVAREGPLVGKNEEVLEEKSVAGRKMMKDQTATVRAGSGEEGEGKGRKQAPETEEEHEVEVELNSILKKSPIIIFSKSYCPYSRKAKTILLEQYKITPAPYVVELDEHPLGQQLQAALAKSTGRRTVPNVLVNGKSIGGGDDIEELHENGKLVDTVKSMSGKRIMEASLVEGKRRRRRRGLD